MDIKKVQCPLTQSLINEYECYLIAEAAEGNIPKTEMPGINEYEIEKKICIKCIFHNID